MAPPDDSGFLGRWAKRKQEVQKEKTALPPAVEAPAENLPAETDESLPLPSLDDIMPGGDVSAFFQKHVPEALRAAALRKVWMTDPDIKDFIEMADYQLDYANPDSIPGWSSKLEGVDLKGMVDRIFNSPARVETEIPVLKAEMDGSDSEQSNPIDDPVHTHSTLDENTEPALELQDSTDVIQNGAVQNKQDESVVYETARKRHGGALPS
ncbi:MAG: DUF3306 domain-containing protein [Beijerinckiaceae bacterium]